MRAIFSRLQKTFIVIASLISILGVGFSIYYHDLNEKSRVQLASVLSHSIDQSEKYKKDTTDRPKKGGFDPNKYLSDNYDLETLCIDSIIESTYLDHDCTKPLEAAAREATEKLSINLTNAIYNFNSSKGGLFNAKLALAFGLTLLGISMFLGWLFTGSIWVGTKVKSVTE